MITHYYIVVYNTVTPVVNVTILRGPNGCSFCNSIVYKSSNSSLAFILSATSSYCYNCLHSFKNFPPFLKLCSMSSSISHGLIQGMKGTSSFSSHLIPNQPICTVKITLFN